VAIEYVGTNVARYAATYQTNADGTPVPFVAYWRLDTPSQPVAVYEDATGSLIGSGAASATPEASGPDAGWYIAAISITSWSSSAGALLPTSVTVATFHPPTISAAPSLPTSAMVATFVAPSYTSGSSFVLPTSAMRMTLAPPSFAGAPVLPTSAAVATFVAPTLGEATVNPNLFPENGAAIGGAAWEQFGGTATVTLNYATVADPLGGHTATRVQMASGDGIALRRLAGFNAAPSTQYTFSAWAMRNGSGAMSHVRIRDVDAGLDLLATDDYFDEINGSTWTRVTRTVTTAAVGASPSPSINCYVLAEADNVGVVDVLLWGAKLEIGAVATGTAADFGGPSLIDAYGSNSIASYTRSGDAQSDWSVTGGRMQHSGVTDTGAWVIGYCIRSGSSLQDGVVEAKLRLGPGDGTAEGDVVARYGDAGNLVRVGLLPTGLVLYDAISGTPTLIGSYAFSPSLSTDYTVRLTMSGGNLTVALNGTDRITGTTARTAAGAYGFLAVRQTWDDGENLHTASGAMGFDDLMAG
jgi:hypothetical protein